MTKKRTAALLSAGMVALSAFILPSSFAAAEQDPYISNADLMPKYVPDSQVKLDAEGTPEWVSSLIMAEVRIQTATPEGTLQSAVKVLDHYQEMGVNGLWITPVADGGETGGGYTNCGPHSIDPALTGKPGKGEKKAIEDYREGWLELKNFIDEAHKRNIRILLDMVSWGVGKDSPLIAAHPDWFEGGGEWGEGSKNFKWRDPRTEEENEDLVDWYQQQLVEIAILTGCDGFRHDLEPNSGHAGYEVLSGIRQKLLERGRKIVMVSEQQNERGRVFDFEQFGIGDAWNNRLAMKTTFTFLDKYNVVDSIKNGENIGSQGSQDLGESYRFYTHMLSCHDFVKSTVLGNRLAIGYQAIFAPFIPLWYMGEEWAETYENKLEDTTDRALYFRQIDWNNLSKPENRAFYEDVKAMIRVRRQYPEIFSYFPEQLRDSNICKVDVTGCEDMLAYARYRGDTAILIVPNYNIHDQSGKMTVYLPFEDMGLDFYQRYTVTDAITGENIVSGKANEVAKFSLVVPSEDMRVIKVQATGKYEVKDNAGTNPGGNTSSSSNSKPDNSQVGEPGVSSNYSPVEDPGSEPDNNPTSEPEDNTSNTSDSNPGSSTSNSTGTQSPAPVIKPENPKSGSPTLWIILGIVGGVVLLGGAGAVIYTVRKRSVK